MAANAFIPIFHPLLRCSRARRATHAFGLPKESPVVDLQQALQQNELTTGTARRNKQLLDFAGEPVAAYLYSDRPNQTQSSYSGTPPLSKGSLFKVIVRISDTFCGSNSRLAIGLRAEVGISTVSF